MSTTLHAPADLAPLEQFHHQQDIIRTVPMLEVLLDAVPVQLLVLNAQRQIVYYNRAFHDFVTALGEHDIPGKRPGQVLHCVHADEPPNGCGTTEFCRTCGAVRAILAAQDGEAWVDECRIQTDLPVDSGALDLRVWTQPFDFGGEAFTILTVTDIHDEKRRQALERVFFHDVMNTASAIQGHVMLLAQDRADDDPGSLQALADASEMLIGEIKAQRDLRHAEAGELEVDRRTVGCRGLLERVVRRYELHRVARRKAIEIDRLGGEVEISTDPRLLDRVLSNMLKNALEATPAGGTVRLGVVRGRGQVVFTVWNPGFIPRDDQLQVFQRSFSTKGPGRGLGTYGMKLLAERYLGGQVAFTTDPVDGTRFSVTLPD